MLQLASLFMNDRNAPYDRQLLIVVEKLSLIIQLTCLQGCRTKALILGAPAEEHE